MALKSPSLHKSQFTCPICLDLFMDPFSIPCGHNFCNNCIGRYWDQNDLCWCPLCKEAFLQKPKLRVNCPYREMVDVFRHSLSFCEVLCAVAEPVEVVCDVCGETKTHKALKSRLVSERLCTVHKRELLELYCQSDLTCVCQFCPEPQHKDPHVVTLSTRIKAKNVDIMADPNAASPWILISEDSKEIRQAPKKQKVPGGPQRFTEDVRVLAKQGFESGRRYWEVGVHNKANWVLGVSRECVHRKVSRTPCPEIGMWTLIHKDGRGYSVVTDRQLPLCLCHAPRKVGVSLDYDAGQVSFFNAETECHPYSYAD